MVQTPPGADPSKWDDLTARLTSGGLMTLVGIVLIAMGGVWFQMLAVFVTAVLVWELWMMIEPEKPTPGMLLAALMASVISGFLTVDPGWFLVFFVIVPMAGAAGLRRERTTFLAFTLAIEIAGWGLVVFREDYGVGWLFWLVIVVVTTDVAGYFAGRSLGGPKFWPKVSPKKTWSGTVAGWLASGLVGALVWMFTPAGVWIIPISMLLSFASQMGDMAESGLKRRMKVKDSSSLIPGHGGLFDRFDGLLGASIFMLTLAVLVDVPGVSF